MKPDSDTLLDSEEKRVEEKLLVVDGRHDGGMREVIERREEFKMIA